MADLQYSNVTPGGQGNLLKAISAAIQDRRWKYRTAEGIAAQLNVSPDEVSDLLASRPDLARRTSLRSPNGAVVWTSASGSRTWREWVADLRQILAREEPPEIIAHH